VDLPGLPWPGPAADETLAAVRRAAAAERGWIMGTIGAAVMADQRDWRAASTRLRPIRLSCCVHGGATA
jgi:hypothetical protein